MELAWDRDTIGYLMLGHERHHLITIREQTLGV